MFKEILKKTSFATITLALLSNVVPTSSHAESTSSMSTTSSSNLVNTETNLSVPVIKQGRTVSTNYPQMLAPTVEAFSNEDGTGTGYLNVSWIPVENVTNYQVILFNGSIHSYWDVPADQTSWTTKGKGMFPTAEQIEAGKVNFLRDGNGTEFSIEPASLYKKAYELNGGLDYSESSEYYVRVTAVHRDGASPISYATTASIPLDDEGTAIAAYYYIGEEKIEIPTEDIPELLSDEGIYELPNVPVEPELVENRAIKCFAGYEYDGRKISGKFVNKKSGTRYANTGSTKARYRSDIGGELTIGSEVSASGNYQWGPVESTVGFKLDASYKWKKNESVEIYIQPKKMGWVDYGAYQEAWTGSYYYLTESCKKNGVITVSPKGPKYKLNVIREAAIPPGV